MREEEVEERENLPGGVIYGCRVNGKARTLRYY
jgi:hypothetical protein